jgi:hypothetical protein
MESDPPVLLSGVSEALVVGPHEGETDRAAEEVDDVANADEVCDVDEAEDEDDVADETDGAHAAAVREAADCSANGILLGGESVVSCTERGRFGRGVNSWMSSTSSTMCACSREAADSRQREASA